MQVRTITDSAIIPLRSDLVPPAAIVDGVVDLDAAPELHEQLQQAGIMMAGSQGGRACLMNFQRWTVTTAPDVVAGWQPMCGCEPCDTAKEAASRALRGGEVKFIAYCDMEYVQIRNA